MESEQQLVREFVATRDEQVFRALYRAHTPRMLSLAMRLTGGNQSSAEDVVQEAWSRACQLLAQFRGESRLSTWLCGIVVNCYREQRRGPVCLAPEAAEEGSSPPANLELEDLVRRLPARCREVLVLHDIEGYRHYEIAEALGIAEGTSKHHLFRARRLLVSWLESAPRRIGNG